MTEMLWSKRPGFRSYLSILGFLFPGLVKYKGIFKVVHLETVREAGVKWLLHEYLLETILFGLGEGFSAAFPDSVRTPTTHST